MSPPSIASTARSSTDIETLPPFRTATSSPVDDGSKDLVESPSSAATIVNVTLDYDGNKNEKTLSEVEDIDSKHNLETNLTPSTSPSPPLARTHSQTRDARFWLVMLSICCSIFLSALDLTSVSTALPSSEHY
jgi:hypothetical protein